MDFWFLVNNFYLSFWLHLTNAHSVAGGIAVIREIEIEISNDDKKKSNFGESSARINSVKYHNLGRCMAWLAQRKNDWMNNVNEYDTNTRRNWRAKNGSENIEMSTRKYAEDFPGIGVMQSRPSLAFHELYQFFFSLPTKAYISKFHCNAYSCAEWEEIDCVRFRFFVRNTNLCGSLNISTTTVCFIHCTHTHRRNNTQWIR